MKVEIRWYVWNEIIQLACYLCCRTPYIVSCSVKTSFIVKHHFWCGISSSSRLRARLIISYSYFRTLSAISREWFHHQRSIAHFLDASAVDRSCFSFHHSSCLHHLRWMSLSPRLETWLEFVGYFSCWHHLSFGE